jgi:hypothetical protein
MGEGIARASENAASLDNRWRGKMGKRDARWSGIWTPSGGIVCDDSGKMGWKSEPSGSVGVASSNDASRKSSCLKTIYVVDKGDH